MSLIRDDLEGWPASGSTVAKGRPRKTGGPWPRVTLVTPSFNQARFLESTILSVLNQGYPDLEYIVIDGGSTDGSLEIIQRYAPRLAYWESQPDRGQSNAINKGWRGATGKYVWWLNSDDMLAPDTLFIAVEYLEEHPTVDMVYGDVIRIDEDGKLLDVYHYRDFDFVDFILHRHQVAQAGGMVRRLVQEKIGYLDESLHFLMDWDYWTRLALAGGVIVHLPVPLALFRIHEEAKTQAGSPTAVQERYRLNRRLFESSQLPVSIRANEARVTSGMHLTCSRVYLKFGEYREALKEAGSSLRCWPFQVFSLPFWQMLGLSLLGILLGERGWRSLRSLVRRLRNSQRGDSGVETP